MSWESLQRVYPWPREAPGLAPDRQNHGVCKGSWRAALAGIAAPVVLEVGVYLGGTAQWLLSNYQSLRHVGIDVWNAGFCLDRDRRFPPEWNGRDPLAQYHANMREWQDRCVAVQATSVPGMSAVADHVQPDVVFIDASHDYYSVLEDIRAAVRLFPRAAVCGDDYGRKAPGSGQLEVRAAVDQAAKELGCKVLAGPGEGRFWRFEEAEPCG